MNRISTLIVSATLASCGGSSRDAADAAAHPDLSAALDGGADASAGTQSVSIRFRAQVGTADFKCGQSYASIGSKQTTVTPSDLRFYVQDVALLDPSGSPVPVTLDERAPWQTKDVALLDFEDGTGQCTNGNAETNDIVTGTVPAGTYTGIVFTNGVPEALDHADPATAPAPLQAGGMTWGWLYGYKFMKVELVSTTDPMGNGYLHVGSIGCTNAADGGTDDAPVSVECTQKNRNRVTMGGFDPATKAIVLDAAKIFASSDLSVTTQCHSDEASTCDPMFASIGLDFEEGSVLAASAAFRVE